MHRWADSAMHTVLVSALLIEFYQIWKNYCGHQIRINDSEINSSCNKHQHVILFPRPLCVLEPRNEHVGSDCRPSVGSFDE